MEGRGYRDRWDVDSWNMGRTWEWLELGWNNVGGEEV